MRQVYATGVAKLPKLKAFGSFLFVFLGGIVAAFAGCASQRYHDTIFLAFTSHVLLRSALGLAC
jgi:hypothetical protein